MSSGSDFLSENWLDAVEHCIDMSKVPHQNKPHSFLRKLEYLLLSCGRDGEEAKVGLHCTGIDDLSLTPGDSVCRCSLMLLRRHLACACLGVSSPLQFVSQLVADLIKNPLLSNPMVTMLKCVSMEILASSMVLDRLVDRARSLCLAPAASLPVSTGSLPAVRVEDFRAVCMSLLEREELSGAGDGRRLAEGVEVWVAYMDAEFTAGNALRARKVNLLYSIGICCN